MMIVNHPRGREVGRILKETPPDKRYDAMEKLAKNGEDFALIAAVKNELDRIEQMAQGPSQRPTTTVAEDLMNKLNQAQRGETQGIAGLPNDLMANANFSSGITSGMGEEPPAQMMAGGGIVAFSGGARVPSAAELEEMLGVRGTGPYRPSAAELEEILGLRGEAERLNAAAQEAAAAGNTQQAASLRSRASQIFQYIRQKSSIDMLKDAGRQLGNPAARQMAGKAGVAGLATQGMMTASDLGGVDTTDLRQIYGYGPESEGLMGLGGDMFIRGRAAIGDVAGQVANVFLPQPLEIDTAVQQARRMAAARQPQLDANGNPVQQEGPASLDHYAAFFTPGSDGEIKAYQQALGAMPTAGSFGLSRMTDPEAPKDQDYFLEQLRKTEGTESAADRERLDEIAKERESLQKSKKSDMWLSVAEAAFRIAAAGEKGASTLGAIAEGAEAGMKSYKGMLAQFKKDNKELRDAEYLARKSQEAFNKDKSERSYARARDAQADYRSEQARVDANNRAFAEFNARIWETTANVKLKMELAKYDKTKQDALRMEIGQIINNGLKDEKTQTQIDAEIERHLNLVARMTMAESGSVQSAVVRQESQNAFQNALMNAAAGGAGDDSNSLVNSLLDKYK